MKKILYDENHNFRFDFTKAEEVFQTEELSHCIPFLQHDVDFIVIEDKIIFLEYKNTNIESPDNITVFHDKITESHKRQKFCVDMAKKFVSSLFWLWACNKNEENKQINYYMLIENDLIDSKMRKKLRNKISNQLPHNYGSQVKREILSELQVINMEEWGQLYAKYPIIPI